MKNANLDSEIRSRIDSFLAELSTLVKSAALDSVRAALGDGNGVAAPHRGPGRPAKAAGSSAAPARRRRGGKRSSEDVQKTGEALLAYVQANPGLGVEGIAKGMGISSKELKLPVIKLIEAGSLRTEGQRRGTKYFAGGSGGGSKAAKGGRGARRVKKAGAKRGRRKAKAAPEATAA